MADELYDRNSFSFDLPVWIIDKDGILVSFDVDRYGECLLVFTDKDLAERAIRDMNLVGATPQSLNDDEALILVLTSVLNDGGRHVAFDLSVKKQKGVFEQIRVLLDRLKEDQIT